MRVVLDYIGCRLNQAEIEAVGEMLACSGYELVEPGSPADLFILNTCSVTQMAEAKCRHRISRARRFYPKATIIAFGCYARRDEQGLRSAGADAILAFPHDLPSLIKVVSRPYPKGFRLRLRDGNPRTKSFIKIQEGCNTPCSYCIVPKVRGRERSRPPDEVLDEISRRYQSGYREIVLTGTNNGRYCYDGFGLKELLQKVLSFTEFPRICISSLQPADITDELLSLWRDKRLVPHFHLPLQSGSDRILRRMGRLYSVEEFKRAVKRIRSAVPHSLITTDILVGFPGEEDEDFRATYNLCREIGFSKLHVFPFSPRPQTPAYSLPHPPERIIKERVRILCKLYDPEVGLIYERKDPGWCVDFNLVNIS